MTLEAIDPKSIKTHKKTILNLYPTLSAGDQSVIQPLLDMKDSHLQTTTDSQNSVLWAAFCGLGFADTYINSNDMTRERLDGRAQCFQVTPFGRKMIPIAIELALKDNAAVAASIAAAGEDYLLGQAHRNATHEYDKAFAAYSAGAKKGSYAAQFMLGLMHQYGQHVAPDSQKAYALYQAAAAGSTTASLHAGAACLRLGLLCAENKISRDSGRDNEEEAFDWFKRGAELGNVEAMAHLFLCYTQGKGTKPFPTEAQRWLKTAAEKGYKDAARKLYEIYTEEKNNESAYLYALLAQINGEDMDERLATLSAGISEAAKCEHLYKAIEIEFSYAD